MGASTGMLGTGADWTAGGLLAGRVAVGTSPGGGKDDIGGGRVSLSMKYKVASCTCTW